jgi:hypothetical protein
MVAWPSEIGDRLQQIYWNPNDGSTINEFVAYIYSNPHCISPFATRGRRRGSQFRLALAIASLPGMTPELCSELVRHYTRVGFLQFIGEFERHSAKLALRPARNLADRPNRSSVDAMPVVLVVWRPWEGCICDGFRF